MLTAKVKAIQATEIARGMHSSCCSMLLYLVALLKQKLKINSVVMTRSTGLNSGTP